VIADPKGLATIVVARLVDDVEVIGVARIDLGERHKTRAIKRAEACCWLNEGGPEDVKKARSWAESNGYTVFTFPANEPEALVLARASLLKRSGS